MTQDERAHLQTILETHRKRLHLLEEKAAMYGIDCPPSVAMEMQKIREDIRRLNIIISTSSYARDDGVYSSLDNIERRLKNVDNDLRKATVKETKTFSLFGFTIWSVVIERVIMFSLGAAFAVLIGLTGHILSTAGGGNNGELNATIQSKDATIQSLNTIVVIQDTQITGLFESLPTPHIPTISTTAQATADAAQATADAAQATADAAQATADVVGNEEVLKSSAFTPTPE